MVASSGDGTGLVDAEVLGVVAFNRRLHEFKALSANELIHVNLDVQDAISRGFTAVSIIRDNRQQLEAGVADLKLALVDALEDYTLALSYAETEYLVKTRPRVITPEMQLQGKTLRQMMLVDVKAMIVHGRLNPDKLRGLKRCIGFINLAADLKLLAHVLKGCGAVREDGVLTSPAQIQHAEALADEIYRAGGRNRVRDEEALAVIEQRDRVFTLFVRSYGEARAGVLFLRRGDKEIERKFPALWIGRRRRPQKPGASEAAGAEHAATRANAAPSPSSSSISDMAATQGDPWVATRVSSPFVNAVSATVEAPTAGRAVKQSGN
jgi:hypothetical protein